MVNTTRPSLWIGMLLCQILGYLSIPLPDPMPEGHVNRDIQILVEERKMTVDIRMSASESTWVEIIRLAESRTNKESLQESDASVASTEDASSMDSIEPIPTDSVEVSQWLQRDSNRGLLEKWVASHCRAEWCATALSPPESVASRFDSRHHCSITLQLRFHIPPGTDSGSMKWRQTAFAEYPGKVRRALKTRGEAMIDSSDVSPLVVRAEFELKTESQSATEREETIAAELRLSSDG